MEDADEAAYYEQLCAELTEQYPAHLPLLTESLSRYQAAAVKVIWRGPPPPPLLPPAHSRRQ